MKERPALGRITRCVRCRSGSTLLDPRMLCPECAAFVDGRTSVGDELTKTLLLQEAELAALRPLRAAVLRYGQALARQRAMTVRELTVKGIDPRHVELHQAKKALDALALALATAEGPG